MKTTILFLVIVFMCSIAHAGYEYRTTCSEFTYVNGKKEVYCKTKKVYVSDKRPKKSYVPPPKPFYFSRR